MALDALADAADLARPETPPSVTSYQRVQLIDRHAIITLHRINWSNSAIAKHLSIKRDTVAHWISVYKATGECKSGKRSGRPRCTDEATDEDILITARVVKFTSPKKINTELGLGVSSKTVARRLNEGGLFGRVAVHKRIFTDEERTKRLAFANGYKHWTYDDWSKVLFSDESTIYGAGFCGRVWVMREIGERFNHEYVVDQKSHPIKVNLWGSFCAAGPGYCKIFTENMDARIMSKVIDQELTKTVEDFYHNPDGTVTQWYLLHDNARTFKNDIVTARLHTLGAICLEFPPYSPDLNPIENLWAILKRRIERVQCKTWEELQDRTADIWEEISVELCEILVRSMPERCQAVIDANGWHTKY